MTFKSKDSQTSPQVFWIRILQGGAYDSNLDHQSGRFQKPYQTAFSVGNGGEPETAGAAGGCSMQQAEDLPFQQWMVEHEGTVSLKLCVGGITFLWQERNKLKCKYICITCIGLCTNKQKLYFFSCLSLPTPYLPLPVFLFFLVFAFSCLFVWGVIIISCVIFSHWIWWQWVDFSLCF